MKSKLSAPGAKLGWESLETTLENPRLKTWTRYQIQVLSHKLSLVSYFWINHQIMPTIYGVPTMHSRQLIALIPLWTMEESISFPTETGIQRKSNLHVTNTMYSWQRDESVFQQELQAYLFITQYFISNTRRTLRCTYKVLCSNEGPTL